MFTILGTQEQILEELNVLPKANYCFNRHNRINVKPSFLVSRPVPFLPLYPKKGERIQGPLWVKETPANLIS